MLSNRHRKGHFVVGLSLNMDQTSSHNISVSATFKNRRNFAALFLAFGMLCPSPAASAAIASDKDPKNGLGEIRISFGPDQGKTPLDGRLFVILSTDPGDEPRLQITENSKTQQIFGLDVDGLAPEQEAVINSTTLGYPLESLRRFPLASTGFRPCCTNTRHFTARTDLRLSSRWTAVKGSNGIRLPATFTAPPRTSRSRPAPIPWPRFTSGSTR